MWMCFKVPATLHLHTTIESHPRTKVYRADRSQNIFDIAYTSAPVQMCMNMPSWFIILKNH